jgi:hypothetical protein
MQEDRPSSVEGNLESVVNEEKRDEKIDQK